MSEDKKDAIREELDEWLAQGKIDRATYDRLLAEQFGDPADAPLGSGVLSGAGGGTLALGVFYLIVSWSEFDPHRIWPAALLAFGAFASLGIWIVHRTQWSELGRALAIVAGFLWPAALGYWLQTHPDHDLSPTAILTTYTLGELALGYLATSAMVLAAGLFYLVPTVFVWLIESGYELMFGPAMVILSLIGIAYLTAARQHLVWRRPRGVWHRFALSYQVLGLMLINYATYALSWMGWDGEGYDRVGARLVCVTATVLLYSLEVWAGQSRKMNGVAMLGIYQFLMQILGILSYPHLSLEQRAVIVIGYAMMLILVAQGETASRRAG